MSSTVCGVSCIIMLNLHSHPMRWGLLSCPFQGEEWGSWGKVLPTVWRSWDLNSGVWPWGCIYFKLALPSWLHIEGTRNSFLFSASPTPWVRGCVRGSQTNEHRDGLLSHHGSISVSLFLPTASVSTCSNAFAHFPSSGHAVPSQEPPGVPRQPEAFQLPRGWLDASEAVWIWAVGTQVWLDMQNV